MKTLAVIFDFDDTLMPDSTTAFLASRGIDTRRFWQHEIKDLVSLGYEPSLAYLNKILDFSGDGAPLGKVTNHDLVRFGEKLDSEFFPGLNAMFKDLRAIARTVSADINVEYYIVSGGLQALIEGSGFVRKHFSAVYGCQFSEHAQTGEIQHIKRCVTFTEKTRYLFEINKGIRPEQVLQNQYMVNTDIPLKRRRVPFKNMIYVGDGLTDIPCFSLVQRMGGLSFGVFNPQEQASAKRALMEFLHTDRVISMHAPKYRKNDELGSLLRAAVSSIAARTLLERNEAESED